MKADGLIEATFSHFSTDTLATFEPCRLFPSVKADGLIEARAVDAFGNQYCRGALLFPSVKADGLIEARSARRRLQDAGIRPRFRR